jgi:ribosomal protein L29
VNGKECGIAKKAFWEKVKEQELLSLKKDNNAWIQRMADIRHLAAHRTIMIPTTVLMHTDESKKSDEELKKELRKQKPYYYSMPHLDTFERLEIDLLRIKKMRKLIPRAIYIKKKKEEESYFYDPVLSVDCELIIMNKFIDKFLEKSFKVSPGLEHREHSA